MASRVRVAIIGLGFGAEFIPIYQNHPDAEMYAICQRNPQTLNKSGGLFGLSGFLREHYTASKESAASIAAYLGTVGNAPAPGKRGSKRAAKGENKGEDKGKLGEEKKGKTKTGEAKGEDKDKVDAEKKPKAESDKEKAKVDAEKKPKAKTGEDKAEKSEKSEKTRKE